MEEESEEGVQKRWRRREEAEKKVEGEGKGGTEEAEKEVRGGGER